MDPKICENCRNWITIGGGKGFCTKREEWLWFNDSCEGWDVVSGKLVDPRVALPKDGETVITYHPNLKKYEYCPIYHIMDYTEENGFEDEHGNKWKASEIPYYIRIPGESKKDWIIQPVGEKMKHCETCDRCDCGERPNENSMSCGQEEERAWWGPESGGWKPMSKTRPEEDETVFVLYVKYLGEKLYQGKTDINTWRNGKWVNEPKEVKPLYWAYMPELPTYPEIVQECMNVLAEEETGGLKQ